MCGLKGRTLGYVLKARCSLHELLSAHCELTVHCEDVSIPKQQTQGKERHSFQWSLKTAGAYGQYE